MNFSHLKRLIFNKLAPPAGVEELLKSSKRVKELSEESVRQSDILTGMVRKIKGPKPAPAKRNRNKT